MGLAGALDCEDETNGGFRETVVMKLTFTQARVFKNPLESEAYEVMTDDEVLEQYKIRPYVNHKTGL